MDDTTAVTLVAAWAALTVKSLLLYVVIRAVADGVLKREFAWRSWAWLMVIVSLAVLPVLEFASGGSSWLRDRIGQCPSVLLSLATHAYFLVVAVLLGLLIHSLVRLSLLRRHSPTVSLHLGLGVGGGAGLGHALQLLRQVDIRRHDTVPVPTTFGVFSPIIMLPKSMKGTVYKQFVPYAVLHAFIAVLRFDALWALIARLVQCAYFVNPAAWWSYRRYQRASREFCDDWSAYAVEDTAAYIASLRAMGDVTARRWFMSPDVPMGSPSGGSVTARMTRLEARPSGRPRSIRRWQLPVAVLAWLLVLAVLGSTQASGTEDGGLRFGLSRRGLIVGVTLAVAAGGMVAGSVSVVRLRRHRRASPGEMPMGEYRKTVAYYVRRVAREWEEVQWYSSQRGRGAGTVLLLVLFLMLLSGVMILALRMTVINEPLIPESTYDETRWLH